MKDPLFVVRELRDYADEPACPPERQEVFLIAADLVLKLHQVLSAETEEVTRQ